MLIFRDSNSEYRVGHDLGSGPVLFGPITINQTAATTGLYVGVEGYHSVTTTRSFDHLEILPIDEVGPSITAFSASPEVLSEPGPVTFNWTTTNAVSAFLNGQDVTGQSSIVLNIDASSDYTLVAHDANGRSVSETVRISVGQPFSIAAVADPQYSEDPSGGSRQPRESVQRLSQAVASWNQRDIDWGVILGDIINWDDIDYGAFPGSTTAVPPQEWFHTNQILNVWDQLKVPGHLVLGNHDYYVPFEDADGLQKPHSVHRIFGFQDKAYYSFGHKGFRFIVLEGDNSHLNYAEGTPEYDAAKAYFDSLNTSYWWNAGILPTQLAWLLDELDRAMAQDETVVVMCHYPVHEPEATGHSLYEADKMLNLLDGYPNVVLWLNGHNHAGDYALLGRRHHLNLKGMISGADNWYELSFLPDMIRVYQAEDTTSPVYRLDILRATAGIERPRGFSVSDEGGNAALRWDAEPAGVDEVIVEARQVSAPGPWQVVAALPAPVTQPWTDSASTPASDFKYRIRFAAGELRSRYSQALGINSQEGTTYSEFAAANGLADGSAFEDADGDSKANCLEQFLGTPVLAADTDPARELRIARSAADEVRLVFSHLTSSLHQWDLQISTDLGGWRTLTRDVDYQVMTRTEWSPDNSPDQLTRLSLGLMDASSRALEDFEQRQRFFRLDVTPTTE